MKESYREAPVVRGVLHRTREEHAEFSDSLPRSLLFLSMICVRCPEKNYLNSCEFLFMWLFVVVVLFIDQLFIKTALMLDWLKIWIRLPFLPQECNKFRGQTSQYTRLQQYISLPLYTDTNIHTHALLIKVDRANGKNINVKRWKEKHGEI